MVVSEMGEQWSPNTEPARVAANMMLRMEISTFSQMGTTMGIRMPNVPQAVPVEKERNAATTNTMAGRMAMGTLDELTTSDTYGPTLSALHTPFSVQARVRMLHAGTMDLIPAVMPSIKLRKVRMRRGRNSTAATTTVSYTHLDVYKRQLLCHARHGISGFYYTPALRTRKARMYLL